MQARFLLYAFSFFSFCTIYDFEKVEISVTGGAGVDARVTQDDPDVRRPPPPAWLTHLRNAWLNGNNGILINVLTKHTPPPTCVQIELLYKYSQG